MTSKAVREVVSRFGKLSGSEKLKVLKIMKEEKCRKKVSTIS